ncbi:hypothetical protein SEA_KOZIE_77 [Microbacterium phage Kozie]|uniref:Uncharacterized protein n=1 Tax=Microbacterium phage Kozie TaxID=2885981 RepID=A0AAE8Y8Z4_9CAUD|nr:hypothetical protein QC998_gp77 [Microbacterium phage Kozie]UDL16273.1 hypothetical protein SEA_KOZIE_77 [Microbacterium phage Kozie]
MSLWNADDYRAAAASATHRDTRRALAEEADRIDRREEARRATTSTTIRITITK